eukprot:GHRQ01010038.1.p1 GENE.GHRQ01010038.1~~GHRQ01010038.1.p1  ORF type:complete len:341 (+),score=152.09 GHRQ01010038.1:110-1024(+)
MGMAGGSTVTDVGGAGVGEQALWMAGAPSVVAAPVDTASLHAAALQPPSAAQRVQLLVQVVRGCACLLARQEPGGADSAQQQQNTSTQHGEQLALMLLGLQLVQALCLPHGEVEGAGSKYCTAADQPDDAVGLPDMLHAASQADLEQLMAGAVELLRLAKALACPSGHAAASGEDCWRVSSMNPNHSQLSSTAGGGGLGCGLSWVTGSLLAQPLPDPICVLYQQALDSCRAAAVEEVMGNWQSSMAGYSLAADLLLFLSVEWPQLGAADPGLQQGERQALHRLYVAVSARLAAVVAEAPAAIIY